MIATQNRQGEGLHPQARGHLTTLAHFFISLGMGILAGIEALDHASERGHYRKATRFSRALCTLLKQGVLAELLSLIVALSVWSPLPTRSRTSKKLLGAMNVLNGGLERQLRSKGTKPVVLARTGVALNGAACGSHGAVNNGKHAARNGCVPVRVLNIGALLERHRLGQKSSKNGYQRDYFAALRSAAIGIVMNR